MSITLCFALVAYLLGIVIQWQGFKENYQELEEYSNFPIVWAAKTVIMVGCFLAALVWPCSLILGNEINWEVEN